jgi:hypothetical protein
MSVICRRLAGLAAIGLLPALIIAGNSSAQPRPHATKLIFEQLLSIEQNGVKTSTHVKVDLGMSATRVPGARLITTATVGLSTPTFSESHSWEFLIGAKDFTTTSKGAASLKSASTAKPYGSIALVLTPAGKAKRTDVCNAENYTLVQPEKVKGSLSFNTHSTGAHAWGKVTFTSGSLSSAFAELSTTYVGQPACAREPTLPVCSSGLSWTVGSPSTAAKTTTTFGSEVATGRSSSLFVYRKVALSKPKNASRTDFIDAKEPTPTLTTSGSSASLAVTTTGRLMLGSGILKSVGSSTSFSVPCKGGTEANTQWTASFTPGPSALRAPEQVFGTITVPTKRHAGFDQVKA